ncbi:permease-like cell division protein FtsX [Massiliimalia massiliensis]|uniref:permease-like cell division protein FtsX n=1 Tax=Massiliimalia massiliensis TaxID=1852384 RepID=UPI000987A59D|nr:permease-like cell division protein FtsX [Massiliimalia massiliensis]
MKANSAKYLVGQGISGLWKNRMMTLASVGVLTACLLIVGFAVLVTENINQIVGYVESQNEMVAFMYKSGETEEFVSPVPDVESFNRITALRIQQDYEASGKTEEEFRQSLIDSGITEEELTTLFGSESIASFEKPGDTGDTSSADSGSAQDGTTDSSEPDTADTDSAEPAEGVPVVYWDGLIQDIQAELEQIPNVVEVRFVSKEEGIESQKESFGDLGYLLDDYTGADNPIRNSFVIKIEDLSKLQETASAVEQIHGIKLVNASNEVATTLTGLRRIINIVGWSIVAALSIVSLVIIINTIRASIFSRRKELNIMKYVGATNSFIRLPFIVEGICLGVISAIVAYLIIWGGYSYFMTSFMNTASSWIKAAFQSIIPFEQIAPRLAVFFLGAGVTLGVAGSLVSIRNHIRV